jgi:hypothetical protein
MIVVPSACNSRIMSCNSTRVATSKPAVGSSKNSTSGVWAIAKAKDNNVRIIEGAVEEWAMENAKIDGDAVAASDIFDYIKGATDAASLTTTTGPLAVGTSTPTLPTTVGGSASY